MINAVDLAKYIVHKTNHSEYTITNLKLQKILYYIAGVYAGVNHEPLFTEEIEAWQYGPVIRSVYIQYCRWGSLTLYQDKPIDLNLQTDDMQLIDYVWERKISMSGRELVNATHKESPWQNHQDEVKNNEKPAITFDELFQYFSNSPEVREWKISLQQPF